MQDLIFPSANRHKRQLISGILYFILGAGLLLIGDEFFNLIGVILCLVGLLLIGFRETVTILNSDKSIVYKMSFLVPLSKRVYPPDSFHHIEIRKIKQHTQKFSNLDDRTYRGVLKIFYGVYLVNGDECLKIDKTVDIELAHSWIEQIENMMGIASIKEVVEMSDDETETTDRLKKINKIFEPKFAWLMPITGYFILRFITIINIELLASFGSLIILYCILHGFALSATSLFNIRNNKLLFFHAIGGIIVNAAVVYSIVRWIMGSVDSSS